MTLIDFFREECIEVRSEAPDKDSLLAEIAAVAKRAAVLNDVSQEAIFSGLKQREELGSTGFQDGIAIPHCLPLFAAFWDERQKGFHRIISASIRHSLANEMLRRIDTLVGGLKECRGVLAQVQDVPYSSGSIEL